MLTFSAMWGLRPYSRVSGRIAALPGGVLPFAVGSNHHARSWLADYGGSYMGGDNRAIPVPQATVEFQPATHLVPL